MRPYILISAFLLSSIGGAAQQFENKFQITLPDSVSAASMEWVDMDNDSLLDVLVIATNISGDQFFLAYKNNAADKFELKSSKLTGFTDAIYELIDFDLDNQIDIVLSGKFNGLASTMAFISHGNFDFEMLTEPILSLTGSAFKFCDLNQDGIRELIISGENNGKLFFNIYSKRSGGWQLMNDTLTIQATSIEFSDLDGDMDNDLFVSGHFSNNSSFNGPFYNLDKYFLFSRKVSSVKNGKVVKGDINHDGKFDIVLTGGNSTGMDSTIFLINNGNSFTKNDPLVSLNTNTSFIADFNSDGKADFSFFGLNNKGDSLNLIRDSSGDYDTLSSRGLKSQRFGDIDRDGDLDLLQLVYTDSLRLVVLENKISDKNLPPEKPFNPIAFRIFDRLFMHWEKPADDHTPTPSLTFDLTLQSSGVDVISADFDQIHHKRLLVSHGNQGTSNFNLLRNMPPGGLNFSIQAIDNSFHAGGKCMGSSSNCQELIVHNIPVCESEKISLSAPLEALWFSFSKGYLGTFTTLEQTVVASDTVFSFIPQLGQACASVNVYLIDLKNNFSKVTESVVTLCEGTSLKLETEINWPSVEWSSAVKGFISASYSITYSVSVPDTVILKINTGTSCSIQRNTIVNISKPVIELGAETVQIIKGGSVQLMAKGGNTYLWQPPTNLDQTDIANPTASPAHTTEYTVVVKDSLGCADIATVLVVVEETAFIPNLFTPNGDEKNDELKIYGLSTVKNFSFSIHNREGNIVYETKDPTQAVTQGWNGTSKGTQQPGGVYYWKIKGEMSNGSRFLLNGKTSGSLVLIR